MSNLRIGDPAGLVAFLHEVIDEKCEVLRDLAPHRIVISRERVFSLHREPLGVSGPFENEAALIRADGLKERKDPEEPEFPEFYFWYGTRFRLDGDEVTRAKHREPEDGA
jgi:hypothetical protein